MLAVADKPVLQLVIEEVVASGIKNICIVASRRDLIERFLSVGKKSDSVNGEKLSSDSLQRLLDDVKITVVTQRYSGGTADALLKAEDFAQNDPFVVLNGDDVIFNEHGTPAAKQLADAFEKTRSCIVGVQKVEKKDILRTCLYGLMKPRTGSTAKYAS